MTSPILNGAFLGYGCSNLMARLGRRESLRALEAAWHNGIRYFDTARLYGYGEAESVLGDLLKRGRQEMTVATKFGINPPKRSLLLGTLKTVARGAAAAFPGLRKPLRKRAEAMVRSGCFDVPTARISLETSLRELKTDYLDYYLLHECRSEDITAETVDFLENARHKGTILRYGIATTADDAEQILSTHPQVADVVQYPNSIWKQNAARIPRAPDQLVIHHSVMGTSFLRLVEKLRDQRTRREYWSKQLEIDCGRSENLAQLTLAWAMTANPSGGVLFASIKESHITSNCLLLTQAPFSPEQIRRFGDLVLAESSTHSETVRQ